MRFWIFAFVVLLCLMKFHEVQGRIYTCNYDTQGYILWDWAPRCRLDLNTIELKIADKNELSIITGTAAEKSTTKSVGFIGATLLEFIPVVIVTEFPNLNGLEIVDSTVNVLKTDFLPQQFVILEYFIIKNGKLTSIEPGALRYLSKLKWVSFYGNMLTTIDSNLFIYSSNFIRINFSRNQIAMIIPSFLDFVKSSMAELLFDSNVCVNKDYTITAATSWDTINLELKSCYDACLADPECTVKWKGCYVADCGVDDCCNSVGDVITAECLENYDITDSADIAGTDLLGQITAYCDGLLPDFKICQRKIRRAKEEIDILQTKFKLIYSENGALADELERRKACRHKHHSKDNLDIANTPTNVSEPETD